MTGASGASDGSTAAAASPAVADVAALESPGQLAVQSAALDVAAAFREHYPFVLRALVCMGVFTVFFTSTRAGKMMQATAENAKAARLVGIRVDRALFRRWVASGHLRAGRRARAARVFLAGAVRDHDPAAIPRAIWLKCQATGALAFDPDDLAAQGVPCFGGLDLSRARERA